jgi:hypothetical protein
MADSEMGPCSRSGPLACALKNGGGSHTFPLFTPQHATDTLFARRRPRPAALGVMVRVLPQFGRLTVTVVN